MVTKVSKYPFTLLVLLIIGSLWILANYLPNFFQDKKIDNSDFELGDLSGWEVWGDPNDCAVDTVCPTKWCNVLLNESCRVSAMTVNITNDTIYGKYSAIIGHNESWPRTEAHAKIDLRKNIKVPEYGNISLFVSMKGNIGPTPSELYISYLLVNDSKSEKELWQRVDTENSFNWTDLNFSLDDFRGKNVTIIFRVLQSSWKWTFIWSDNNLITIDNLKIAQENENYTVNQNPDKSCVFDSQCNFIIVPKTLGCQKCDNCTEYSAKSDGVIAVNSWWKPSCKLDNETCRVCNDTIVKDFEDGKYAPACINRSCEKVFLKT